MSKTEVMQCDLCGKLLPNPEKDKGIHTETMDFCESCKDSVRRDLKGGDVKSIRAYHILIDIIARMLEEEARAEEATKKPEVSTTNTSGFAPASAVATH
jgi:hypothetical protein